MQSALAEQIKEQRAKKEQQKWHSDEAHLKYGTPRGNSSFQPLNPAGQGEEASWGEYCGSFVVFLAEMCVFLGKFLPGGCFLGVMIDITLIFHDLIFFWKWVEISNYQVIQFVTCNHPKNGHEKAELPGGEGIFWMISLKKSSVFEEPTPPKTNMSPKKGLFQIGNTSEPTIDFQGTSSFSRENFPFRKRNVSANDCNSRSWGFWFLVGSGLWQLRGVSYTLQGGPLLVPNGVITPINFIFMKSQPLVL